MSDHYDESQSLSKLPSIRSFSNIITNDATPRRTTNELTRNESFSSIISQTDEEDNNLSFMSATRRSASPRPNSSQKLDNLPQSIFSPGQSRTNFSPTNGDDKPTSYSLFAPKKWFPWISNPGSGWRNSKMHHSEPSLSGDLETKNNNSTQRLDIINEPDTEEPSFVHQREDLQSTEVPFFAKNSGSTSSFSFLNRINVAPAEINSMSPQSY